MKLWLDDLRYTPYGYTGAKSVNEARRLIEEWEKNAQPIEVLDLDYDLGAYEGDGGNGLRLLEWLLQRETFYRVEIHSSHPYGAEKMQNLLDWYWP